MHVVHSSASQLPLPLPCVLCSCYPEALTVQSFVHYCVYPSKFIKWTAHMLLRNVAILSVLFLACGFACAQVRGVSRS